MTSEQYTFIREQLSYTKVRENEARVNSFILSIYFFLCLFAYCAPLPILRTMTQLLLVLLSICAFYNVNRIPVYKVRSSKIFLVLFSYIVTVLMTFFRGNLNVLPLLSYVIAAPAMAYFVCVGNFNKKIIFRSFWIIVLLFLSLIALHKDMDSFMNSSRNFVSVVIIMQFVVTAAILYKKEGNIPLISAGIAFLICLFAIGRSGIIFSAFIFFSFSILDALKKNKYLKTFIILSIITIVVFCILNIDYIEDILTNVEQLQRFNERGIHDYSRDSLKEEYLKHMDFVNILTGYNFDENATFNYFNGNPHNSYIKLHSRIGFIFFFIIIAVIRSLYRFAIHNKVFFILFLAVLGRCWTDVALGNTFYDFIILYFIFESNQIRKHEIVK